MPIFPIIKRLFFDDIHSKKLFSFIGSMKMLHAGVGVEYNTASLSPSEDICNAVFVGLHPFPWMATPFGCDGYTIRKKGCSPAKGAIYCNQN